MDILKNGIDKDITDTEKVTELVKVVLPHQVEYIEKHGPSGFYYLLEELESMLLMAFELMLKGEESDQETLKRAEAIIKQSEQLMDSDHKAKLNGA